MGEGAAAGNTADIELAIFATIRQELREHDDDDCDRPVYLILLNSGNYALLGWDEIYGLPVLPADDLEPMRCRIVCGERGWAGAYDDEPIYWLAGEPHVIDPPSEEDLAA